jgi:hypothetical protein
MKREVRNNDGSGSKGPCSCKTWAWKTILSPILMMVDKLKFTNEPRSNVNLRGCPLRERIRLIGPPEGWRVFGSRLVRVVLITLLLFYGIPFDTKIGDYESLTLRLLNELAGQKEAEAAGEDAPWAFWLGI